jgi:hypothetical protein
MSRPVSFVIGAILACSPVIAPGRGITIMLERGTLYGAPTRQSRAPLIPQLGTTYYVGGVGTSVTFTDSDDGQATALILRRASGSERTAPRAR